MDRKKLIREYKDTPRPMGVYRVRNTVNDTALIGTSLDLPAVLNRHRAQLRMGGHRNRQLQSDWDALGPDAFIFEMLDTLSPSDQPGHDPTEDLRELMSMWMEKLAPSGDAGY